MDANKKGFLKKIASITIQTEIGSRLEALTVKEIKDDYDDEYKALDNRTIMINQLAPLARPDDCDDEASVIFLTKAVEGTEWGLNVQHEIQPEPTLSKLMDALNT